MSSAKKYKIFIMEKYLKKIDFIALEKIGITEIDNQHIKLYKIIDNLRNVIIQNKNNYIDILYELRDYSIGHFNTEEFYVKKYLISSINDHIKDHNNFLLKILNSIANYNNLTQNDFIDLYNFLIDWLHNHMNNKDIELKKFINSRNKL